MINVKIDKGVSTMTFAGKGYSFFLEGDAAAAMTERLRRSEGGRQHDGDGDRSGARRK